MTTDPDVRGKMTHPFLPRCGKLIGPYRSFCGATDGPQIKIPATPFSVGNKNAPIVRSVTWWRRYTVLDGSSSDLYTSSCSIFDSLHSQSCVWYLETTILLIIASWRWHPLLSSSCWRLLYFIYRRRLHSLLASNITVRRNSPRSRRDAIAGFQFHLLWEENPSLRRLHSLNTNYGIGWKLKKMKKSCGTV